MIYLLDTNTCIRYINGRTPLIRERMRSVSDNDIVISAVTMGEMFAGSAKSQYPQISRAKQDAFFIRFRQLAFDARAADAFGEIRADLERRGTPIGAYDMQIAAIAMIHRLIVVTHNTDEFRRIRSLSVEDWEV